MGPEQKLAIRRRRLSARRPRPSTMQRIWLLNAAIAAAAAAGFLLGARKDDALVDIGAPWYALALAVLITERFPVHLEFQRSAHSFSFTDVPVTLALVFLSGPEAVAAVASGSAVALALRGNAPVKLVFNLGQFVLATVVGIVVIHGIADVGTDLDPLVWLGAFLATQIGGLLTIALISSVIRLADGSLTRRQVRQMFAMDAVVTATNTSFALLLGVLLVSRPEATPMVLVPMSVAFFGYRHYVSERQRHEKLEFLYEANKTLSGSIEISQAIEGLLERALEAFRAEQAEVVLFSADGRTGARTSLGPGTAREHMVPVGEDEVAALRALPTRYGSTHVRRPFPKPATAYLESRGLEHVMAAELNGEERVVGMLLLGNRLGLSKRFAGEDLALFDTMAVNASAALQFDRLEQAVSELRNLQERLHHQAFHDALTDLANRSLFAQRVQAALERDGSADVAVLFIDLDDFKTVNDTLGHSTGDQLLRAVASRLQRSVRDGDLVARLGGDEFAVLVTRASDIERASAEVAARVLEAFAVPVTAGEDLLSVRVSVGIATTEHSERRAEDLLRDADVAMYEAKDAGKGRHAMFNPVMREALLRRHAMREALDRAIHEGELAVQYQPIVELATRRTVSLEALVRWDDPERGRVPPSEFIALAEETGLIVPLGRFVLGTACRAAVAWPLDESLGEAAAVQVNLSAVELEDPELIPAVTDALAASGLPPDRLVLEITETLLVRDAERGAATVSALRELGVRLALDDFGTGYSSLSYLRSLPLDFVKIAKPFIDHIAVRAEDAAFIRLIVGLSRLMGLTIVAEGVETEEQLTVLRELGCDLGQGFLFSPPVDAPHQGRLRSRA